MSHLRTDGPETWSDRNQIHGGNPNAILAAIAKAEGRA